MQRQRWTWPSSVSEQRWKQSVATGVGAGREGRGEGVELLVRLLLLVTAVQGGGSGDDVRAGDDCYTVVVRPDARADTMANRRVWGVLPAHHTRQLVEFGHLVRLQGAQHPVGVEGGGA
ncbi:hypothetical protein PR002_g15923 [Phytophthora rubi]|uniref:Uncharacterized protein n=1 Tax=Phytophthora rubi TaxID=129364 RepID=A0A6A3KN36_9STRA|nr:hypothetical protein PR002_g15923 [Phytophthora rubi]